MTPARALIWIAISAYVIAFVGSWLGWEFRTMLGVGMAISVVLSLWSVRDI
jgi:hypothetical protein